MNKVELLPKSIIVQSNNTEYDLRIYVTAWGKLCLAYQDAVNISDKYVSIVIEPENEPTYPNENFDNIGNTRNLDDACDMMNKFIYASINKNLIKYGNFE